MFLFRFLLSAQNACFIQTLRFERRFLVKPLSQPFQSAMECVLAHNGSAVKSLSLNGREPEHAGDGDAAGGVPVVSQSSAPCKSCGRPPSTWELGPEPGGVQALCTVCSFRTMDPFRPVEQVEDVLHLARAPASMSNFSVDVPDLRRWRKEGYEVEMRMLLRPEANGADKHHQRLHQAALCEREMQSVQDVAPERFFCVGPGVVVGHVMVASASSCGREIASRLSEADRDCPNQIVISVFHWTIFFLACCAVSAGMVSVHRCGDQWE